MDRCNRLRNVCLMMTKTAADSKANRKKPGSTIVSWFDSCQGKDANLLFRITSQFIKTFLALNVIVGIIFNLAKVNTVPYMFKAALFLGPRVTLFFPYIYI